MPAPQTSCIKAFKVLKDTGHSAIQMKTELGSFGAGDLLLLTALCFSCADVEDVEKVDFSPLLSLSPHLHIAAVSCYTLQSGGPFITESKKHNQGKTNGRSSRSETAKKTKSVMFSVGAGGAVSPPNDRRPASWVNSFSLCQKFHNLLMHVQTLSENHDKLSSYLWMACKHFLCDNEDSRDDIIEGSNKVKAFFAPLVDEGHISVASLARPFEVCKMAGLLLEELSMCLMPSLVPSAPPTDEETHTLPIVSELRHRSSWMASSVVRYVMRWLYDQAPYSVSTPSAAGPVVIPHSRSELQHSLLLESRGDQRLRSLCFALKEGEESEEPLPCLLDMDPAEMAPSSLLSCALRQLEGVERLRSNDSDNIEESLLALINKSGGDDAHVARVIQVCVAGEYARQFLLDMVEIEVSDSLHQE